MEGEGPTLKYREIITVKTVTFSLKALKARKNAGTIFILLRQLRNIVKEFKKSYLHRPIMILHFLTPAAIQKC